MDDDKIVMTDGIHVRLIDSSGELWCSPRISWDGIKELKLKDNLVTGLAFNPMNEKKTGYHSQLTSKQGRFLVEVIYSTFRTMEDRVTKRNGGNRGEMGSCNFLITCLSI